MAIARRFHSATAAMAVVAVTSCSGGGDGPVGPFTASAATQICDQFGGTTVLNRYNVNNNRFGSQTATQCVSVTDSGFTVERMWGVSDAKWKPIGYPFISYGCHWGQCSPNTSLPMQLSRINSVMSSVAFGFLDGPTYNAAYDIWLDPNPAAPGVQQMEIMIFFNGDGVGAAPPDRLAGNVSIGGKDWEVIELGPWENGGREVVYTGTSRIPAWEFDVLDFIKDVRSRGYINDDWFLTSVQAGLECYTACPGVSLNSFSVEVTEKQ